MNQQVHDIEWWRAVIGLIIMVIFLLAGIYLIRKEDSPAGKFGGIGEYIGLLLFAIAVWFFISTFQPPSIAEAMRIFNPWQVNLVEQPNRPALEAKAEYDLVTPDDPMIGDKWYLWQEISNDDMADGVPVSKKRRAGLIYYSNRDGRMSRTQEIPH